MELPFKQKTQLSYRGCQLNRSLNIPLRAKGVIIIMWDPYYATPPYKRSILVDHLQKNNFGTFELEFQETEGLNSNLNGSEKVKMVNSLIAATRYLQELTVEQKLPFGLFGVGHGAEAALRAASFLPQISTIVTLGETHDLNHEELAKIHSPTLLLLENSDYETFINMIRLVDKLVKCPRKLEMVAPSHEKHKNHDSLVKVTLLTQEWFHKYMKTSLLASA